MNEKPNAVIVSAFGRGHWLAAELKNLGYTVDFVDVSESLGRWAPEDAEGPFGYFQTEQLTPTQKVRLDEEDYSEVVDEGFTLWLKSGPMDMRGPHSSYLLEKREVPAEVLSYLAHPTAESLKKINPMPFHQKWLACLAHSISSPIYTESVDALNSGSQPLPIASPLHVRRVSRRGAEKSMGWLRDRGIRVFEKARIKDISVDEGRLVNIEIESEWSGILSADQFVWSLTGPETARLSPNFLNEFFGGQALQPDWIWQRYRLDLQAAELNESLPLKWVMVEDLALPWTHSNLLMVQKTSSKDSVDVWMRLPAVHRFQKTYIEKVGQEACDILSTRIPRSQPKVVDYPQEYHYDESTLGPARYWCLSADAKTKKRRLKNLKFDGPENWPSLDWTGQFQAQKEIFDQLVEAKNDYDKKLEKLKAKEAAQ